MSVALDEALALLDQARGATAVMPDVAAALFVGGDLLEVRRLLLDAGARAGGPTAVRAAGSVAGLLAQVAATLDEIPAADRPRLLAPARAAVEAVRALVEQDR